MVSDLEKSSREGVTDFVEIVMRILWGCLTM
jgi:hypothetical protein